MVLNEVDPDLIKDLKDRDDSTVWTATTPPETLVADNLDDQDPLSKGPLMVPWPGSTYIIRSVESGQVITLLNGQVRLTQPGSGGAIHWACVESRGWLGFRNTVSGKLLGHDRADRIYCSADRQREWENFCVRTKPDGGCVLLQPHYERLGHVGIRLEQGIQKLVKVGEGGSHGPTWEFAKV